MRRLQARNQLDLVKSLCHATAGLPDEGAAAAYVAHLFRALEG